ncbi:hypothetical protein Patl1_14217 [Pistacia atlantica]|uniref:Uncharacterized protein n=1 Tax=Pistacia atlantica TaxID=434234 RepID=A0ACC1AW47_9ROSI|nr:hypothetical protein Patl1_14217 [Pistacia atlantica]
MLLCMPKLKTCEVGMGIHLSGCLNDKCNADCAAKYPGDQDGHGYCYTLPPYQSCHCLYLCYDQ